MDEDQPIRVLPHGADRIAAALLVVRNIEQELHVPRVRGIHDLCDFLRLLAERVHVMVVRERNADLHRPLAEFRHQAAQSCVVVRDDWTSLRPFIDHLEV